MSRLMHDTAPLDPRLTARVLRFLGQEAAPPSLAALDALVTAYTRRVPWESVSRIVRRANVAATADCPRWPVEFWSLALGQGSGGTCYESNYAFFALLRRLGYAGYLTINDMRDSVGCHSAMVVMLDDCPYLVDVGLPIHLPLPLDPQRRTARQSWYHRYSATPQGTDRLLIERDNHPRPDCFTLIDRPVTDAEYRRITTDDYGPHGLFLDRAIVNRVLLDGAGRPRIWRFSSAAQPYQLESFQDGAKAYHLIGSSVDTAADVVAGRFGLPRTWVARALALSAAAPPDS